MNTLQDRIRGSLIGGAIGDALGYPIEFMSLKSIKHKYGDKGYIKHQEFNKEGKAVISDDTQMTLFTAVGLLNYATRVTANYVHEPILIDYVKVAYKDWLQTQYGVKYYYSENHFGCWIRDIKELNVRRAPGNTCMSALLALDHSNKVENDSKGCGGVMRVAPVGLMAATDTKSLIGYYGKDIIRRQWTSEIVAKIGGECAKITHKHPLGYLPAAFMADLIYHILLSETPVTFSIFEGYLGSVCSDIQKVYSTDREQKALEELWAMIEKAIDLAADSDVSEEVAIRQLGEGWTGDEALAIAIYCTMRHIDCFEDAVLKAINHDGDSDSTGAICGNLMGAIVGYEAIPGPFVKNLELKALITEIADDIVQGFSPEDKKWATKYIKKEPYFEDKKTWFGCLIGGQKKQYNIMPRAMRAIEARNLLSQITSHQSDRENAPIWYQLAIKVYDTETFDPFSSLSYNRMQDDPRDLFMEKELQSQAAWYYGYEDPKYSPKNTNRVFKLNLLCFEGKNPVIAVRNDTLDQRNELPAGLMNYYEKSICDKYPGWMFYLLDPSTADGNYAVFTNQLEKEFAVEIAHLWEDGTLHRIYHLFY